jgi:hypothetical protein
LQRVLDLLVLNHLAFGALGTVREVFIRKVLALLDKRTLAECPRVVLKPRGAVRSGGVVDVIADWLMGTSAV